MSHLAYLEIGGVAKRFGKQPVLDGVSLEVNRGECVVVFGPSGCGKTTLLRIVAGVMEPDAGEIRIDGRPVNAIGPEARGVAMAFQNFALYPHLSAFDNIASPLRARRIAGDEVKRRVHEIASLLRIEHVLDHVPRALSNGQKQRTSLARSLVHGPSVLMLDDPLRNVDAKIRYEMRVELPRIFRRFGSTVLYVTQDYREALALGDRVGVLLDGRFRQVDTPARVYESPGDRRIASLFGDPPINLLPVEPVARDGGLEITLGGHPVRMPDQAGLAGRRCLLGIRPEHVGFAFDGESRASGDGIPVELDAVTPFNVRSVMLLRTGDATELLASRPEDPTLDRARGRRRGTARIDFSHALFFDAASGERIAA